jgi:anaerobic magnesium-protoporphyrin IX monomethyl ester cyclase
MKVTFVLPKYSNIWEPVGVGLIISYCKSNYRGRLKFVVKHENFDRVSDIIGSCLQSDVVAFSCTTPTYKRVLNLARFIKKQHKKAKFVVGGWHPTTVFGKEINTEVFDHIVIGEGEKSFLSILEGTTDKIVNSRDKLSFTELPWADRNIIHQERHLDLCYFMCKERIASLQSVRGCKMHCTMCGEYCMSGIFDSETNPLRIRNPVDVVNEIEYLHKYFDIDRFKFLDPTWSVTEESVFAFCEEKIRRGNKLKWDAMVHAGIATEKSLEMMSKANCDIIMVGCESGSQKVLNSIRKGLTVEKIKKVFEWGRKYGLNRRAFFILGLPEDTKDSIEQTKKLIRDIDPDIVGFTILCPYPGSDYYEKEKFNNVDWQYADEYSNDFWKTDNFTNTELKKLQEDLSIEFYNKLPYHQREVMRLGV